MPNNVKEEIVRVKDFESFLQKCLNCKQLELVNLESTKLLPLGENFGSTMLKVKAKIQKSKESKEEILNLVAKTISLCVNPIVIWSEILRKEIFMYTDIIPVYQNFEREMGIMPVLDIFPKYIGHRCSIDDEKVDEKDSILVLENLQERGFYTCERLKGVDLDHCKLAFSNLAKFHAIGIALRQKHPRLFESLLAQARPIGINFKQLDDSFESVLQIFRENSCFAKNMETIEATFSDAENGRIYAWRPSECHWGTIIHADFWTNNIMFHKDVNGRVDGVKLVDFQIYIFNNPLRDLTNFLAGGNVNEDIKDNHIDNLLNTYYDAFIERLELLGCDVKLFSRESFDVELKREAINIFPLSAIIARFYVFDYSKDHESTALSNILQSKSSDALIKRLQGLVEFYEKRAWF